MLPVALSQPTFTAVKPGWTVNCMMPCCSGAAMLARSIRISPCNRKCNGRCHCAACHRQPQHGSRNAEVGFWQTAASLTLFQVRVAASKPGYHLTQVIHALYILSALVHSLYADPVASMQYSGHWCTTCLKCTCVHPCQQRSRTVN
jgi:hypothetical protein